jgi:membrane protease YdiL (CAAX protease family)
MFVAFFLAALGEEWGRMGYAIDPLQPRLNALQASILPGLVWTAWQCLFRVTSRLLFVWLYDNRGKSVFTATVYHAILNITWQLFPINGS